MGGHSLGKTEKKVLQWHPAFYAGLQIEFEEEADKLIFESEHNLSTKPLQIDVLIIKKQVGEKIKKNIGQIFRECNIIEYKSPTDYLSIDDYYKVYAYTCLYKADTGKTDEVKLEGVTITLASRHYPRKLIKHLKENRNLQIEKHSEGIYYVIGEMFPVQILVMEALSKEENFWLRSMTTNLTKEEAEEMIQKYDGHEHDKLYQSVMDVVVRANEKGFREMKQMCDALLELMEDELKEMREKGISQGISMGRQEHLEMLIAKKVEKGKTIEQIAEELEETVEAIAPLYAKICENSKKIAKVYKVSLKSSDI